MPPQHELELVFKDLFAREYDRLCRYAYTYMQDEHLAEDVVQETFVKIWEQKKELISNPDIKFYLITAVRNNCITVLRKQKNQRTILSDNTPEPEPEPFFTERHHRERQNEDARRISQALDQLPPKCKEVFLLVKMQGMSYKEAARTLDISVKTIENQMGKAIKVLRDYVVGQTTTLIWMLFLIKNL